jgi:lipoprotein-anchoring transpeptidase ErfK/SrfK
MTRRALSRRPAAAVAGLALLAGAALSGCSADSVGEALGNEPEETSAAAEEKKVSDAKLQLNVPRKGAVGVDTLVQVTAKNGTLRKVRFTTGGKRLPGSMSENDTRWTAGDRLEPGTTYKVTGVAVDDDGLARKVERTFRTDDLTLDEQTYPSLAPLAGETVGVGMPVILSFDIPVTDRKEVERHLDVQAKPAQPGTWHWISDTEVHYRPKSYWKPGTEVTVDADLNGVDAGNGIYGQEDRRSSFTVGDAVIMKVDVDAHQMRVLRNGELLRTIPISAGKPGFTTRSGIKVIIEKHRYKDMDAATTGISEDDAEYYNISNVEYAQRVTYSGEFIHAAPWSVGSQGYANVSHGCVGMSTEAAGWLYNLTKIGDPVETTGTDRQMDLYNGYGDWNASFAEYKKGSALS